MACHPYSDHRENCACAKLRSIFLEELKNKMQLLEPKCVEGGLVSLQVSGACEEIAGVC